MRTRSECREAPVRTDRHSRCYEGARSGRFDARRSGTGPDRAGSRGHAAGARRCAARPARATGLTSHLAATLIRDAEAAVTGELSPGAIAAYHQPKTFYA
jgi:hypothetical protein